MNKFKQGFTLIELLVVIVIIGVLAAVALPQYQKAILKSRYSALMPIAKTLAEGNEVYYLESGRYTTIPSELSIEGQPSYPEGTSVALVDGDDLSYVSVENETNVPNARYVVYQNHSNKLADATVCEAFDERTQELCQQLGGTPTSPATQSGWAAYLLTGTNSSVPGECKVGNGTFTEGQAVGSGALKCEAVCNAGTCEVMLTGGQTFSTGYCAGSVAYTCAGSTFSGTKTYCTGSIANGCANSNFEGTQSYCKGTKANGCAGSTFSGTKSYCTGSKASGCVGSTFTGNASYCTGGAANACTGSTFSGAKSYCKGTKANGCAGTTILGGAYCTATVAGGCDGVTYQENSNGVTGCCQGDYCPVGAPKCGNWNDTTQAYDIDGTW